MALRSAKKKILIYVMETAVTLYGKDALYKEGR